MPDIDDLDARLIRALAESPRASVVELGRRLGVARGTVQSRVDKLVERGVIAGFGPDVALRAIGYPVLAFSTLEIAQGRLEDVIDHVGDIPEVLEVHAVSGAGDLLVRIAARTNDHLHEVLNEILEVQGISRSTTVVTLSEQIPYRVLPLVDSSVASSPSVRSSLTAS